MTAHDLIVRDAYLPDQDDTYDVAIDGSTIQAIEMSLSGNGKAEIDAGGNVVMPGFVDSHLHIDKAYSAASAQTPAYNDRGLDLGQLRSDGLDYYLNASREELVANAERVLRRAVENGTLTVRAHVNVGNGLGTKIVESALDARARLNEVVDVEIALFPDAGIQQDPDVRSLMDECLEMGADIVGGADPAAKNRNVEATIDAWFDIAIAHNVPIDCHLHSAGTLGMYELQRLAAKAEEHDYGGRVTASHSFGLADAAGKEPGDVGTPDFHNGSLKGVPEADVAAAVTMLRDAGVSITSSYHNVRPGMPLQRLREAEVPVGWGSDNVCDYVVRHAQPDPLLGAYVNAFKLDYNFHSFATNQGLDLLWWMITDGGAEVLNLDEYGIREGTPADLVVLDEPSPQWAIINQAEKRYVVKAGTIVAEDGTLRDEIV